MPEPTNTPTRSIIVCGGGLAASLTALSLARGLDETCGIIQIRGAAVPQEDVLYGNATDPASYNFLRRLGLDEPTLLLKSAASFSYGCHFRKWLSSHSWLQCHHAPFKTISGIPLFHHVTRASAALQPLLVSAQAALAGRFAHPPSDPGNALSQAEYGYQTDPCELTRLVDAQLANTHVRRVDADIRSIEAEGSRLTAIQLDTGETVTATLFIDASGPSRRAINSAGGRFNAERTIGATKTTRATDQLGPPCREIETNALGWTSKAFLQNGEHVLHVGPADTAENPDAHFTVELGHLTDAWVGNCVAIGHAASVVEPLTPAPMIMLQRDIERLLELIPVLDDMSVEQKEFNRRFREDTAHITMFQDALLSGSDAPASSYWRDALSKPHNEKLERKIKQFTNRGILTRYDLEPFNDEDWTIAHMGMGRVPSQYDRQVDRISKDETERNLTHMSETIKQLIPKMPPHHIYVAKLKQYLEKKNHV